MSLYDPIPDGFKANYFQYMGRTLQDNRDNFNRVIGNQSYMNSHHNAWGRHIMLVANSPRD
jgi:hypothetical protein